MHVNVALISLVVCLVQSREQMQAALDTFTETQKERDHTIYLRRKMLYQSTLEEYEEAFDQWRDESYVE